MEAELCPRRRLSFSRGESGDEELSVLPRHTKVVVTGNNRTKSVLVGLHGIVKKAVGLGGWHWLVLANGVEVKLQRNALSVLEAPPENEANYDDDDESHYNNFFCGSLDTEEKEIEYSSIEFQKPTRPRVRHAKQTSSMRPVSQCSSKDSQSRSSTPYKRVNLAKLRTASLWRYWRYFNLVSISPNPSKDQLLLAVQNHFLSEQVDEMQVIVGLMQTGPGCEDRREDSSDSEYPGIKKAPGRPFPASVSYRCRSLVAHFGNQSYCS